MESPIFDKQITSVLFKDSIKDIPLFLSSTDEITYIATQNSIYESNSNNKLTKIFESSTRIKNIYCIHHINIIIIVYDNLIEFRNLNSIENLIKLTPIALKSDSIIIWNNLSSKHIILNDSISDMMSLATVVLNSNNSNNSNDSNEKSLNDDLISLIGIISKNQIVILKWINNHFVDRYNLYISKVKYIQFINDYQLLCISSNNLNDLIHVNLKTSKILHNDLSNILNFKNSILSFNNYNNQLSDLIYFNNKLIFLKFNSFLLFNYPNLNKKFSLTFPNSNFKYSKSIFPFMFLIYDNNIEIRSILNFKLFQNIEINSINQIDYHDNQLSILTKDRLLVLNQINYNKILDLLYIEKDYDNAILLIENLDISNFVNIKNVENIPQLKFEKLRKFQLLKAIHLLNKSSLSFKNFSNSIDIFTEYLASPNLVISNLPTELKNVIENGSTPNENEKIQIYQLINFLTDSRRKLIKLLDNKNLIFRFNNLEISLSIYKTDDSNFSIIDNLSLLDNYLFNCYILINPKMVNPFLRLQTYCDFQLVEDKCKKLNLLDQLITFYYSRKQYQKSIDLLINLNKIDELVLFLQKIIQLKDISIDLIINNLKILIDNNEKNNYFESLLMNDNLDYSNVNYKKIIDYLKKNNLNDYFLRYLEYLVFNQNIVNLDITNELFDNYLNDIDENFDKIEKLYNIGTYNSNKILKKLKKLPINTNIKKLMIPPLVKLGKYDDVLDIFIKDLHDIKSCVDFCLQIRETKNDSLSKGLIFKVIDICLKNKDYSSIVNYILNNTDLDYINFEEILIKLPKDISINLMSSFLVMNMKKLNTINHNLIIKNELLKVNVIDLKLNKMGLERKMVKLTQNSICVQCGRNFNKSEILCFHPNGDIVHYKCSKKM